MSEPISSSVMPERMNLRVAIQKWLGPCCGAVSILIGAVFCYKKVFYDDVALITFSCVQAIATLLALVLGLLSIRYWQGKVALVFFVISVMVMHYVKVGIH